MKIPALVRGALIAFGACCLLLLAQDRPRTVWDGVYTEAQAKRGEPLYNQHCGNCHGQELEGREMAPALAGGDFLDKWDGQTLGDLLERIRVTMPQDKPGKLSRDVNVEILAYMLRVNEFPAGKADLPRDTLVLKQIQISAMKPDSK